MVSPPWNVANVAEKEQDRDGNPGEWGTGVRGYGEQERKGRRGKGGPL